MFSVPMDINNATIEFLVIPLKKKTDDKNCVDSATRGRRERG